MKTADLIPFILLELKECDKYGFELTKAIETKSNGNIIIKQPTLYTILKKLEKSKFITSYWENSEIGGKRHYYKITENGLKQASTFPAYEDLLKEVCGSNFSTQIEKETEVLEPTATLSANVEQITPVENNFSIFDHLQEKESIIPSEEVFSNSSIDSSTETEINRNNTDILKTETVNHEEQFANNKEVAKFTENVIATEIPTESIKQQEHSITPSEDNNLIESQPYEFDFKKVQYVDYVDFKKDEQHIYAKKTAKNATIRIFSTCTYLLLMLVICSVITGFTGRSSIYHISQIIAVIALIFIPTIYAAKFKEFKHKLHKQKLNFELKKRGILCLASELVLLMVCMVANILMGNNSISKIFSIYNFESIYTPIILGSTLFFDLIITKVLLVKNK